MQKIQCNPETKWNLKSSLINYFHLTLWVTLYFVVTVKEEYYQQQKRNLWYAYGSLISSRFSSPIS